MGCACNQSNQLLGALMGDVSGRPVHIEAPFSLGVELFSDAPWYEGSYGIDIQAIQDALNESDYTSGVGVFQISGVLHPFIAVEGYSAQEYGRDGDLRNAILSVIDGVYGVGINRGTVRFEVETYDPTTGQTQTTRYDAQTGGSAGQASPEGPGFLDQLGQSLGISERGTQYVLIGAAVLLAALLLKR